MNEIKTFIKNYWLLLIAGIAIVCLCFYTRSGVHDNGVEADDVRHEIGTAISQQHEISRGLQEAESTAGTVADSINRSESASRDAAITADDIETTIEEQRKYIDECKQIIARVRARDQKTATEN